MAKAKITVSVDGRPVYKIEHEAVLAERERIIKLLEAELKLDPYSSVLRRLQAGITQDAVKGEDIE